MENSSNAKHRAESRMLLQLVEPILASLNIHGDLRTKSREVINLMEKDRVRLDEAISQSCFGK